MHLLQGDLGYLYLDRSHVVQTNLCILQTIKNQNNMKIKLNIWREKKSGEFLNKGRKRKLSNSQGRKRLDREEKEEKPNSTSRRLNYYLTFL